MNQPNKNQQHQQEETKYVFDISPDGRIDVCAMTQGSAVREIPPKVYSLQYEAGRLFLQPEMSFKMPERIYGKVNSQVDRFLRSYELNSKNLGVLLIGDAGSGKTLTLKETACKANEVGMPFILVNEAYPAELLIPFFSKITQPCGVGFDEVDKVYGLDKSGDRDAEIGQRVLLQLLDGAMPATKKLFMFTANDMEAISKYMKDRPSRIRYTLRFRRLDLDTVVDYVSTNLKDCTEENLRAFVHMCLSDGPGSSGMNFDSMCELVSEMNQFKCDMNEAMTLMLQKGSHSAACFEVTMFVNGQADQVVQATGHFQGAYLERDKGTIIINAAMPDPAVPGEFFRNIITLTSQHFLSFGATNDIVLYKKDDVDFSLRYVDYGEGTMLSNKQPVLKSIETSGGASSSNPLPGMSPEALKHITRPMPSIQSFLSIKHMQGASYDVPGRDPKQS